MAEQTLWTSYTPTAANENDSVAYTLGITWYAVVPGFCLGAKWRFPNTLPSGSVEAKLWEVSGDDSDQLNAVQKAVATFVAPVAGQVNEVRWSTPVAVVTNKAYVVSIRTPDRYVVSGSYFSTPWVAGDLRAPQNGTDPVGIGTLRNGKLNSQASHTFPHQQFAASNYWVDTIFTVDDPSGATPTSSDAATATDAATLAVAATGTDAATGTQSQTLSALLASSQPATFTDAQSLDASSSGTDSGTGAQNQTLTTGLASSESSTFTEGNTLAVTASGNESGALTEGWSLTVSHASSETGAGTENNEPPSFMSSDSATMAETQALAVSLTSVESANLIEGASREIEGQAGEIQQYPITIQHRKPGITIRRGTPGITIRS